MSNPDYPEGVTERDIDRIGEPFPLTEEMVENEEEEGDENMSEEELIKISKLIRQLANQLAKAEQMLREKENLHPYSLRQWYAGIAMQGFIGRVTKNQIDGLVLAEMAFTLADAMLEYERQEKDKDK